MHEVHAAPAETAVSELLELVLQTGYLFVGDLQTVIQRAVIGGCLFEFAVQRRVFGCGFFELAVQSGNALARRGVFDGEPFFIKLAVDLVCERLVELAEKRRVFRDPEKLEKILAHGRGNDVAVSQRAEYYIFERHVFKTPFLIVKQISAVFKETVLEDHIHISALEEAQTVTLLVGEGNGEPLKNGIFAFAFAADGSDGGEEIVRHPFQRADAVFFVGFEQKLIERLALADAARYDAAGA